jgi:hypothetical protein
MILKRPDLIAGRAFCMFGGWTMSIYNHGRRRRRRLTEHTVDAIIGLMVGVIVAFVLYLFTLVVMSL